MKFKLGDQVVYERGAERAAGVFTIVEIDFESGKITAERHDDGRTYSISASPQFFIKKGE